MTKRETEVTETPTQQPEQQGGFVECPVIRDGAYWWYVYPDFGCSYGIFDKSAPGWAGVRLEGGKKYWDDPMFISEHGAIVHAGNAQEGDTPAKPAAVRIWKGKE